MKRTNRIADIYSTLRTCYGKPQGQWNVWCKRPKTTAQREQVIIESILTQHTNWRNVEMSMTALRQAGVRRLGDIVERSPFTIQSSIRSSGFYRSKTKNLIGLARFIVRNGGVKKLRAGNSMILRQALLELRGIGPETADSILLYALDKPVFVIDEYTRRLVKRKKITHDFSYASLQRLFEQNIKKDYRVYQDFHALIVIDGKSH